MTWAMKVILGEKGGGVVENYAKYQDTALETHRPVEGEIPPARVGWQCHPQGRPSE